ncbi:hypothetical protein [Nocardioides massiliensis]|uniref:Uncharacterized protein n=1 Tax=Nocardioides massiliensis TaxID=1325935 RepID=A0ABT9NSA6_9ACTN|nr:hypothetical protein [Nocardioides massiliensis]MDP9822710.1 hypothetical protein [Nocardioides massiliensis]
MDDANPHHEAARSSTPGSTGPQGAAGGMGISSERQGPDVPDDGRERPRSDIEGTGTVGSARDHTDGTTTLSAAETAAVSTDLPEESAGGVEPHPDPVPSHELGNKNPGHQRS